MRVGTARNHKGALSKYPTKGKESIHWPSPRRQTSTQPEETISSGAPHNRMGGLMKQGAFRHWIYSNIPEISSSNTPRIEILMSHRLDLGNTECQISQAGLYPPDVIAPLSPRCDSQDCLQTLPHVPRVKVSLAEAPLRANCSGSVC